MSQIDASYTASVAKYLNTVDLEFRSDALKQFKDLKQIYKLVWAEDIKNNKMVTLDKIDKQYQEHANAKLALFNAEITKTCQNGSAPHHHHLVMTLKLYISWQTAQLQETMLSMISLIGFSQI